MFRGAVASILLLVLSLFPVPLGHAGGPDPAARAEIAHLFEYLEGSGCLFYRNGSWHGSREASAHLRRKYEYLLEKGLVSSAEEFVGRAAARSSASGKPYRVRCGGGGAVESGPWFREELSRYRRSGR